MTKKQTYRLLFLSVLSQCLIDNIEDGIGDFTYEKDSKRARNFKDRLLEIMNADFGSHEAVGQLVELTVWIEDMFYILVQAGELEQEKQDSFETEWEELLTKYGLKHFKQ